jgi:surface polysaccharide O-acyltransferase-like enzyme
LNDDDADNGKGEVKTVKSSSRRYLVPLFVVILGVLFISASGGSDNLPPQGKEYSTVTFYVA